MRGTVLASLALCGAVASAGLAANPAREILDRRKALDEGVERWTDRHQRLKLTISGGLGGERVRDLEFFERKYPGGDPSQKQILFFATPPEVKGTAFLSWQHRGKSPEQWLYLPELKRVRQIVARARQESFVGTDLSYHDLDLVAEMPSWSEADARSSLVGPRTADGVPCHEIALAPQRDDIGYARIVVWIAADDLVTRHLELYDADGLVKTIEQGGVRRVGSIPVAHHVVVRSPSANTQTVIEISDVHFNQALEDELFTQRALERGGR